MSCMKNSKQNENEQATDVASKEHKSEEAVVDKKSDNGESVNGDTPASNAPGSVKEQSASAKQEQNTTASMTPDTSQTVATIPEFRESTSTTTSTSPRPTSNAKDDSPSSCDGGAGTASISVASTATTKPTSNITPGAAAAITRKSAKKSSETSIAATKKRPYRRTKRPVGYNDRSSVTTTTEAMFQCPVNVYDAVLQESQDLLTAAQEAQQLGRLKMTSAYLLLLHARLVGLGKRFDKYAQQQQNQQSLHHNRHGKQQPSNVPTTSTVSVTSKDEAIDHRQQESDESVVEDDAVVGHDAPSTPTRRGTDDKTKTNESPQQSPPLVSTLTDITPPKVEKADDTMTPKTQQQAAKALAQLLPSNIELDKAMIEHLAKAAAELHAARSGRSHTAIMTGSSLFSSTGELVPNATSTNQKLGNSTTALHAAAVLSSSADTAANSSSIAWTTNEIQQLNTAIAAGNDDPKVLMDFLPGRSEQQVKAYLRNQTERARVEADLELPPDTTASSSTAHITTESAAVPAKKKQKTSSNKPDTSNLIKTKDGTQDAKHPCPTSSSNDTVATQGGSSVTAATPVTIDGSTTNDADNSVEHKRKGGRGRKPQTTAMNTVPNAICNARALLQGVLFHSTSSSLSQPVSATITKPTVPSSTITSNRTKNQPIPNITEQASNRSKTSKATATIAMAPVATPKTTTAVPPLAAIRKNDNRNNDAK